MKSLLPQPRAFGKIGFVVVALAFTVSRAGAQNASRAMREMSMDTLATAPTTPTRSVADSAPVADSLLKRCQAHAVHSIDDYSTCIGDGIGSLSSAGNIALAMGTLDLIIHRDPSLVLLGHSLAHALGYAVRSTPATATCSRSPDPPTPRLSPRAPPSR